MGDRGRGDTPKSSDGIVPYWSSHLEGAQSELIVPSDHGAHENPKAIAEVDRILKLNLKTEGVRKKSVEPRPRVASPQANKEASESSMNVPGSNSPND